MYGDVGVGTNQGQGMCVEVKRTTFRGQFSPSTVQVLGIELRLSGLVADVFLYAESWIIWESGLFNIFRTKFVVGN